MYNIINFALTKFSIIFIELSTMCVYFREVALETVRPNQNSSRELDGLMKLLEARLCEIKAQEKHNEKQVLTKRQQLLTTSDW